MRTRNWWSETLQNVENFQWNQSSKRYYFDKLNKNSYARRVFNHFEFHHEISTKDNLLKNLELFYEVLSLI